MIFAALAKLLLKAPDLLQAAVLGLCSGLFVSASMNADERDPVISRIALQVLVVGLAAGVLFYAGLRAERRRHHADEEPAPWVYAAYALVWLGALVVAIADLVGAGGFKVAALAIVPLVLLAAPAFAAIRALLHRGRVSGGRSR